MKMSSPIPSQKSIACTPRPQKETLAQLHQTRVGDWSKVMASARVLASARQQRQEKQAESEALAVLHDLSPAEYEEIMGAEPELTFTQGWQRDAVRVWPYALLIAALLWLFVCLVLGGLGSPAGATTATFYTSSPGPCSNGKSFAWNTRHYHGRFVACNHYALGTRLILSRPGHKIVVTVADRGSSRIGVDCAPKVMRELAGPKYGVIGHIAVRVRRVGR